MKLRFTVLLSVFLSLKGFAQTPFVIPYASDEKEIDGRTGDWNGHSSATFSLQNDSFPGRDFANHADIQLEWDEWNLYGLIRVTDHHLIKLRYGRDNPTLYLGDAIEVYIDPLNDSRQRMDVNDYQFIMDIGGDYAVLKGDKYLAADEWRAPKATGEATVAFRFKSTYMGTLNSENDRDSMWTLEFALPWAALGKVPGRDSLFRLDICLNDMDAIVDLAAVAENEEIPAFSYGSWTGERDFSYPDQWKLCRLSGEADVLTRLGRWHFRFWPLALASFTVFFVIVIWLMRRKIRRLQNIPLRSDVEKTALGYLYHPSTEPEKNDPEEVATPNAALFDKLRKHVLERLQENPGPEDLARAANMSLRQLQRIFKEELALSPGTFIVLIKMERAADMLRTGKANVSEVAYQLGFSDPGYFGKVFRRYFGVSPREFPLS